MLHLMPRIVHPYSSVSKRLSCTRHINPARSCEAMGARKHVELTSTVGTRADPDHLVELTTMRAV